MVDSGGSATPVTKPRSHTAPNVASVSYVSRRISDPDARRRSRSSVDRRISASSRARAASQPDSIAQRMCAEIKVVASVLKIDDAAEEFVVDFEVFFRWKVDESHNKSLLADQEAKGYRGVITVDESVFDGHLPILQIHNAKMETLKHTFSIDLDSGHAYAAYNWIVNFREGYELSQFPYDTQQLPIRFDVMNARMVDWNSTLEVPARIIGEILHEDADVLVFLEPETWNLVPRLSIERLDDDTYWKQNIIVQRVPTFFLWSVGFTNFIIVAASFMVVGIPCNELADRLSVLLTCMLTSVAFKFAMMQVLPVVSYLTRLDKYVLISFGCLGVTAIQCFIARWVDPPDDISLREIIFFSTSFGLWIMLHILLAIATWRKWLTQKLDKLEASQRDTQEAAWHAKAQDDVDGPRHAEASTISSTTKASAGQINVVPVGVSATL